MHADSFIKLFTFFLSACPHVTVIRAGGRGNCPCPANDALVIVVVTCEIKLFQNYFSLRRRLDVRLKYFYFRAWWKLA